MGENDPSGVNATRQYRRLGGLTGKGFILEQALEGRAEEHHRFLLRLQLRRLDRTDSDPRGRGS
jgi:hypothetical protein